MKWNHCMLLLLTLVFLLGSLAGCGGAAETQPMTEDPNLQVTAYTLKATSAQELAALDAYPNLQTLDLRGSTCYQDILAYITAHPQVQVQYDVRIGEEVFDSAVSQLELTDGTYSPEELLENLQYLPELQTLSLANTTLSAEELNGLGETYPQIALDYSLQFQGTELSHDVQSLDLSDFGPEQLEEILEVLPKLGALTEVQLMTGEGTSNFALADVKQIMDAAPDAEVLYSFTFYGKTLTTADARVEYKNVRMGNDAVPAIREVLDILPKCTYFLLDNCRISNDTMAQLRDDYPDAKVVWRVSIPDCGTYLTDVTVFRCVGGMYNSNARYLKYLTDVVYLDLGHCYNLSDLSFASYMPNLKVAIVSDCNTADLTPFSACKKLQYIEIVNCNRITDVSPLASCPDLRGVNMSYTFSIDDLSPLYTLENLERLFLGRNDVPAEVVEEARAALPNCWVTDKSKSVAWIGFNYSVGWRLDDEHTFAEWYKEIKEVFGYKREIY